jgi:dTDP-4-amino-4,6-dideoxygalactose transaminase
MTKKITNYGNHYIDIRDKKIISKSLNSDLITTGSYVETFEKKICNFVKVKHVVAVNNGTSAIFLALKSIDILKDDVIIMPAINFIASYSAASQLGAKIYLCDINLETGQMSPKTVLECIKKNKLKKIKCLITMYHGGSPDNVGEFYELKKKFKFKILEDACHAFGSAYVYKNKKNLVGSCKHSDLCTFSFHPVKTITTGEGGAITTNNYNLYKKIKILRSHGILKSKNKPWNYNILDLSFNFRISDINCALGISQLGKIKLFLKKRRLLAIKYNQMLKNIKNLSVMKSSNYYNSANHLFVIYINFKKINRSKDDFFNFMKKNNIQCQYHYIPIYKFKKLIRVKQKNNFFNSEIFFNRGISIPIFFKLSFKKQDTIVKKIKIFMSKNNLETILK